MNIIKNKKVKQKTAMLIHKQNFNLFIKSTFIDFISTARLRHKCFACCSKEENIYQSLQNNLKFYIRFGLYESSQVIHNNILSPSSLWFTRSLHYSNYEWYLQKSLLKDIFSIYHQFFKKIKKRRNSPSVYNNYFQEEEVYNQKLEYFGQSIMKKFVDYIYPTLIERREYQISREHPKHSIPQENQRSYKDSVINIEKNVMVKHQDTSVKNHPIIHNTIHNNVNMNRIMDHIYQNIDEQLRYERLKKGY